MIWLPRTVLWLQLLSPLLLETVCGLSSAAVILQPLCANTPSGVFSLIVPLRSVTVPRCTHAPFAAVLLLTQSTSSPTALMFTPSIVLSSKEQRCLHLALARQTVVGAEDAAGPFDQDRAFAHVHRPTGGREAHAVVFPPAPVVVYDGGRRRG